jgi:hypothetical protein
MLWLADFCAQTGATASARDAAMVRVESFFIVTSGVVSKNKKG